ncbi:hypothetical protein ACFQX8_11525 [Klenkia terrae]
MSASEVPTARTPAAAAISATVGLWPFTPRKVLPAAPWTSARE